MEQTGKINLEMIRLLRQMMKESEEQWDGKREQAERFAEKACKKFGMKTFVIRRKRKYDWVFEPFFDTYEYKGKIYKTFEPNLDAEV